MGLCCALKKDPTVVVGGLSVTRVVLEAFPQAIVMIQGFDSGKLLNRFVVGLSPLRNSNGHVAKKFLLGM